MVVLNAVGLNEIGLYVIEKWMDNEGAGSRLGFAGSGACTAPRGFGRMILLCSIPHKQSIPFEIP